MIFLENRIKIFGTQFVVSAAQKKGDANKTFRFINRITS
jgi:hypothetical protein